MRNFPYVTVSFDAQLNAFKITQYSLNIKMADLHSHLFLVIFATDINFIVVFFRKITVICAFITAIALFAQNNLCADSVEASLLICSPGHNVYELEGHAGLRLRNRAAGYDVAVNYGLFDFNSPNFIYRFVKGKTDYMVGVCNYSDFVSLYLEDGRYVAEWPLNLDAAQSQRLLELVKENLRPENRVYRYNYLWDNCSTRPLAIVEMAVGDSIFFTGPNFSCEWSFRNVMQHYHRRYPWYQFGIDLALGPGIDRPITDRQKIFAPVLLNEMIPDAYFYNSHKKLSVNESAVMHRPVEIYNPDDSRPMPVSPVAFGVSVLAFALAVSVSDLRKKRVSRWADAIIMGLYGAVGCVIAFLVFVSTHEATSPNWLLLWLNPACLIVPVCVYIKRAASFVLKYEIVNFVALIALAVAWPWLGQQGNPAFIPLILADVILSARYIYLSQCIKKATVI